MPTTISRTSFTDDTGDGLSGDIWNSTLIGTSIYDPIDAFFTATITHDADTNLIFRDSGGTESGRILSTSAPSVIFRAGSAAGVFIVQNFGGTNDRFRVHDGGLVFVNDNTNTGMTIGLTLNQEGNDDEILALKSSDIAHGRTSITETDTYALFRKLTAATGGVELVAVEEAATPTVRVTGVGGVDDSAKSTSARSVIELDAAIGTGTTQTAVGTNGNAVGVRNNTTTRWICDGEGDVHYDGTTNATAWDDHDDVALITGLRALTMRDAPETFARFIDEARPVLEATGVLSPDGFVSTKGLNGLLIDAIRQVHDRAQTRIDSLERRLRA